MTYAQRRNLALAVLAAFIAIVLLSACGTTERALFVINELGVIHWSYVSPVGVNPGADGILRALESMQSSAGAQMQEAAGSASDARR